MKPFDSSEWYLWPKMAFKMSQEFLTTSILGYYRRFSYHICYTVFTYTFVIPPSKQKHTTGSLTHTHTHTHTLATATITNKKQLGTSHRLLIIPNGHLTGADVPFVCEIPTTLTDKKIYIFLLTLDWLWGCLQTLIQQRHVNGTKLTPSQNCGNLLLELHVSHESAWPAFLMPFLLFSLVSIHLLHGLTVPPTKVCLLCASPTGTYWVQSPGFPKIIYSQLKDCQYHASPHQALAINLSSKHHFCICILMNIYSITWRKWYL